MQHLFGIVSKKRNLQFCIKKVSALYDDSRIYYEKELAYCIEVNSRASFNECFHISKHVDVLIAGDVINKEFLIDFIFSIKKENPEDSYTVCKNSFIKSIAKIDGIFCIVIFDTLQQKICILSEESGIIPIYYYFSKSEFIFACSIKAILSIQNRKQYLNYNAIYELFKLGHTVSPDTLFQDIQFLQPGTVLEFNGNISLHKLPEEKTQVNLMSIDEAADNYYTLFKQAILKRVSYGGKIGLLLSGGIDSAAIAAMLHRLHIPVKCYTLDANPKDSTEVDGAKTISKLFRLEHLVDCFHGDILSILIKTICLNEAPIYNGIMEYTLSQMIEDETNVILSGIGNDLVWGVFPADNKNLLSQKELNFSKYYLSKRELYTDLLFQKLFLFPVDPQILCNKIESSYTDSGDFLRDESKAEGKIIGNCGVFLSEGKLRINTNRQFFRFPYMDRPIETFVQYLPETYKQEYSKDYHSFINKYLFKYMLERKQLLPKEIIHKRKAWMYSPNPQWLRTCLKNEFEKIVFDDNAIANKLFNMNIIKQLWKLHIEQKYDFSTILMMILQFELWYELNYKKLLIYE